MEQLPNPGLRTNYWVRLPYHLAFWKTGSVCQTQGRPVQFKKSMGTMSGKCVLW